MDVTVDLRGKAAVITGGAGVLCSAMSRSLAAQGAMVAVLDLKAESAKAIAAEIESSGGRALGVGADVLDKHSLLKAREAVIEAFGTVDILINGAGGNSSHATTGPGRSFFQLEIEAILEVLHLNFMGTLVPTQVFGEVMAAKKRGVVINISSMAAFAPLTRTVAYCAGKAAVSNFTQWLAVHLNQEFSSGLRVNAIAPGFILTEQNKYLLVDEHSGEPTSRGQSILRATPMGKYGRAEDLVGAVLFLCSEAASFINGAIIPIDGAFSAHSGV